MQSPETMVMAGTVIKIVVDILKEVLPSYLKPFVAIGLGMAWALAFFEGPIDMAIFLGVTTGASAIGIHEMTKVGTTIKKSLSKKE